MMKVRTEHNEEFQNFLCFLMPEYEKNCLCEYVNQVSEGKYLFADLNN